MPLTHQPSLSNALASKSTLGHEGAGHRAWGKIAGTPPEKRGKGNGKKAGKREVGEEAGGAAGCGAAEAVNMRSPFPVTAPENAFPPRHGDGAPSRRSRRTFKGIDDHQMLVDGFFHPPFQTDIVRAVVGKELVQMADNVDENRVSGRRRQEGMELGVQFAVVLPVQEF